VQHLQQETVAAQGNDDLRLGDIDPFVMAMQFGGGSLGRWCWRGEQR